MKTRVLPFITIFIGLCATSNSQSQVFPSGPGGVTGVKAWMKTKPVNVTRPQDLYHWQDASGDSIMLRVYDARGASYGAEYRVGRGSVYNYNFNPGINLGLSGNLEMLLGNTALPQSTILSVWGPSAEFNLDHFLYNLNGRAGNGALMTQDYILQSNESGKSVFDYGSTTGKDLLYHAGLSSEPTVNAFQERALRVQTWYRALQPNTTLWGEPRYSVITMGGAYNPLNVNNNSTFTLTQLRNILFYGYTPEFIVYDRILNPLERRQAESYLALKYGLSLDKSYIGSDGSLLWDIDGNREYNNRITGYERDDASGLYQTFATTSYEEAPCYSGVFAYDTYYLSNSNYESTPYRLLAFGRMKGNSINNKHYFITGDNGDLFTTSTAEGIVNMKVMQRKWLVNTNIQAADTAQKLSWNVQNLNFYTNNFISSVTKTGSDAAASGTAVTDVPLQGRDGYFSWIVGSYYGPLTIKFGTQNPTLTPGSNDYGYYINSVGTVYPVKGGVQSTTAIYTIAINQKIEIEKTDSIISFRVNGYKIPLTDITVLPQDTQSQFYGSVKIDKNLTYDVKMNSFQTGGFVDTGDRLELSYIASRASDFYNYRSQGYSFLIIDRSGTGNFDPSDVDYIPSSAVDETRSKIIFNNVFWNKRGTGKEVFTFGYKLSNVSGMITTDNPVCVNDTTSNNGSVHVKMTSGLPGFSYTLMPAPANGSGSTASGIFFTDSLTIDSLAEGTYNLTVQELGGTNFSARQPDGGTAIALSQNYTVSGINTWSEFRIAGTDTHASLGIMATNVQGTNPNLAAVNNGIRIDGHSLYSIVNGEKSTTAFASVNTGDLIRMELSRNTALVKINGSQVYSMDISVATTMSFYYTVVSLDDGSSPVYNTASANISIAWYANNNMLIATSKNDKMSYTVTLNAPPCTGKGVNQKPADQTPSDTSDDDNHFTISYPNYPDLSQAKITVSLDSPSPGQVLIYSMSGKLIKNIPLADNVKQQDIIVNLPSSGVYIIKAITDTAEYTKKTVRH